MRKAIAFLTFVAFSAFIAGCGSGHGSSLGETGGGGSSANEVPVSLTITDAPPAGVTVLYFQLGITAATLSGPAGTVSLLSGTTAVPVNVTQLQTDSDFLGTKDVPAGTYTSLTVTVANPQLTIFNGSGATIGSGATACASNSVCQLTPATTSSTVTFNTSPFPVTLTANSPLAFALDVHLDTILQSDLTVDLAATDGITVSELSTPESGRPMSPLGNLTGTIQGVTTGSFTLATGDGRTFNIEVNSDTVFSYPSATCGSDTSACLATNQIVRVNVSLQPDGTLLASSVDYVQSSIQNVVEGDIIGISTSGNNTILNLVLQSGPPTATANALPFGRLATVTIPSTGVTFAVDSNGFTPPNGLTFTGASNLAVGQQVSLVAQGAITTPTAGASTTTAFGSASTTAFTASSVTLEPSQITGSIAAVNAGTNSFTLSTLPTLFVPPAANSTTAPSILEPYNLTVITTSATTFTNLTPDNIAGLYANDVVSVSGWLYSTPTGATQITIAAQSVVGRPGPVPLF